MIWSCGADVQYWLAHMHGLCHWLADLREAVSTTNELLT